MGLLTTASVAIDRSKFNQLRGRDIDIWNAIAKDTGLRVTYVLVSSPSALLAALDEGKVDAAG